NTTAAKTAKCTKTNVVQDPAASRGVRAGAAPPMPLATGRSTDVMEPSPRARTVPPFTPAAYEGATTILVNSSASSVSRAAEPAYGDDDGAKMGAATTRVYSSSSNAGPGRPGGAGDGTN